MGDLVVRTASSTTRNPSSTELDDITGFYAADSPSAINIEPSDNVRTMVVEYINPSKLSKERIEPLQSRYSKESNTIPNPPQEFMAFHLPVRALSQHTWDCDYYFHDHFKSFRNEYLGTSMGFTEPLFYGASQSIVVPIPNLRKLVEHVTPSSNSPAIGSFRSTDSSGWLMTFGYSFKPLREGILALELGQVACDKLLNYSYIWPSSLQNCSTSIPWVKAQYAMIQYDVIFQIWAALVCLIQRTSKFPTFFSEIKIRNWRGIMLGFTGYDGYDVKTVLARQLPSKILNAYFETKPLGHIVLLNMPIQSLIYYIGCLGQLSRDINYKIFPLD